ncbi:hypothetical protein COCNU_10G001090 [Cocos nucifera]|uniref:ATP-sulfurylase PUA-like domain-containing protein n=1 Tax=Cocos nucifera TaxID=13894 RepID=A0A8K0IKU3_COCNU|nr:hypothetical protein COCNU_10G001090 [Cocos nucifera]
MPVSSPSTRPGGAVRRSRIDPDGEALMDLVVPRPRCRGGDGGWASPLRGFMRENEYLQSLHFHSLRLRDGSVVNISLPIVLSIIDADREAIGDASDVAYFGPGGDFVAILRRCLLEMDCQNPILLLHLLGGFTKEDDGATQRGPTEVQWHAKARINSGANFYTVVVILLERVIRQRKGTCMNQIMGNRF